MIFLSFFLAFGLLVVLHGGLDSNFKLCVSCCQGGDWETKWPVPWFYMWWIIDTSRFEFESGTFLWFCYITFVRMENRVCLSRGVQVVGATWRAASRIMTRVEDLVQRTEDGQAHVGYLMARRSRGRVMQCGVCTTHVETRSAGFLVEPQNQDQVSWLSLKIKVDGFLFWASKPATLVWWFVSQNHRVGFLI
jgi:hypothetical protein